MGALGVVERFEHFVAFGGERDEVGALSLGDA